MITSKHIITSHQIENICEEWLKRSKVYSNEVDIYDNPGSSDITSLLKGMTNNSNKVVRYVTDARKSTVYVWDASLSIHASIRSLLGLEDWSQSMLKPYAIDGFGNIRGGRIVSASSDGEGIFWKLEDSLRFISDWESKHKLNDVVVRDFLNHTTDMRTRFDGVFNINWGFLGRYIVGADVIMNDFKNKYMKFMERIKKYGN